MNIFKKRKKKFDKTFLFVLNFELNKKNIFLNIDTVR